MDLSQIHSTLTNLSLVGAGPSVQVQEPVTVSAEVSTQVTQYDGCCLPIVMVVTHGLRMEAYNDECFFYLLFLSFKFGLFILISPSASADHLFPSTDQRTVCPHGPGPAHRAMLRPTRAIKTVYDMNTCSSVF